MTTTPGSGAPTRPSVAVVGAGIAGLSAAHALQATHRVTLLEAEDRLGGHAHTHTVRPARRRPGGGRLRLHRPQRPHLPRAPAPLRRPRGADPADRDEHERHLRRLRARLRRRPLGAAASSPRSAGSLDPRFWRLLLVGAPLPEGRPRACSESGRGPDLRRLPRPRGLRRLLRRSTTRCRSSPACGRWATRRRWATPRRTSSRSCATTASWCCATPRPGTPSSAARARTSTRSRPGSTWSAPTPGSPR